MMAAAPSLAEAIEPVRLCQTTPLGERVVWVPGWQMNRIWDQTNAQKIFGVIRRETQFHDDPAAMVISGPMFHVGNPFYKTPKAICRTNSDYQVVDLTIASNDYLPVRTTHRRSQWSNIATTFPVAAGTRRKATWISIEFRSER